MHWSAIILVASKKSALRWLIHIGGPGLILLGLADNSFILPPGSTDLATVLLAAHHGQMWPYYAIMATAGSILGGYLTYRMARKGGQKTMERFPQKRVATVYAIFERFGFAAVVIPALLPPPFPIVPMLLAAGALQYPTRKFLAALAVGRGIRFTVIAYLGAHYGRHITTFFARYYWPVLLVFIAFAALVGLFGLFKYKRGRPANDGQSNGLKSQAPRRAA
jgi:membrane protein YqaA with SNARE-associated domain